MVKDFKMLDEDARIEIFDYLNSFYVNLTKIEVRQKINYPNPESEIGDTK